MNLVEGYDPQSSSEDEGEKFIRDALVAGNRTTIILPNKAKMRKIDPVSVLAAVCPEEAQESNPLHGPLLPRQQMPGGLYRQFRNYEMGHLLQVNKQEAEKLAELYTATQNTQETTTLAAAEESVAAQAGVTLAALGPQRVQRDDPADPDFLGPWAPCKGEMERREQLREISRRLNEQAATDAEVVLASELLEKPVVPKAKPEATPVQFHVNDLLNYQGKSWIEGPTRLGTKGVVDSTIGQIYSLPKHVTHTFKGHTQGINRIRWFPNSAHLLLSGSMDSTVKMWSVGESRRLIATYKSHTKAVRDINFTTDGRHFYSASFDCTIKYVDTEYGKVVNSFGNDKLPFCCTVHPDPALQHVVICASQNKKAVQYDSRTGSIAQEYNEHLAAVNTVTFCENGKKLVTTSDDKKMFVWEFGIGVVVKHIAEPYMHAMPAVQLDPTGNFLACQSMDNQIVVYEGTGRFRLQPRRRFRGHLSTGYAILPGFSPDAAFLTSGDSAGRCWIWDWKSSKVHRSLQAHDGVCMGAIWHPHHQSLIATSGWDGLIKLWE